MTKLELLNMLLERNIIDSAHIINHHRQSVTLFKIPKNGLEWIENESGYVLGAVTTKDLDYARDPTLGFPESMREYLKESFNSNRCTIITCNKDIPEELLHDYIQNTYRLKSARNTN